MHQQLAYTAVHQLVAWDFLENNPGVAILAGTCLGSRLHCWLAGSVKQILKVNTRKLSLQADGLTGKFMSNISFKTKRELHREMLA